MAFFVGTARKEKTFRTSCAEEPTIHSFNEYDKNEHSRIASNFGISSSFSNLYSQVNFTLYFIRQNKNPFIYYYVGTT